MSDASTSEPSYSGAFNFVKASSGTPEYTYDSNGNLTRDSHKKIAKIQYNLLNLPSALQFNEGHTSEYLYDAVGVKRRVKQVTTTENLLVPMGSMLPVPTDKVAITTQTDYCGNVIYENGTLSRILVDGGYITMSGTTPTYHYYIQDHLGNNRVVFNQNGIIEQTNHYYPFGMTFGEGIDNSDNIYKYNGKELDRMHGLDLYDYGARLYDPALGRWHTPDELGEIHFEESPYCYVGNNPILRVDPDGRIWDTVFDVAFTLYDVGEAAYQYAKTGSVDKTTKAALAADALAIIIPGVTGAGVGVRITAHADDAVRVADKAVDAVKAVNGNSKASEKAQHVYEIVNKATNKVEKVGISGGKVSKAGESYRATSQVNKLNKAGGNYTSRIVENIPVGKGAREKALKIEKEITNRNKGSINPDLHRRPKPE